MPKKKTSRSDLADPSRLPPLDPELHNTIQVIIETPKGSRNKYAFDPDQKVFELTKVLPAGMTFPYDFRFIPSTRAEDGDPVDVLVLMDEPAFPGCLLKCRVVGIIEGQQGKKKNKTRNDRIIAVEKDNHRYAHIRHERDLGKKFVLGLEEFFVNYYETSARSIGCWMSKVRAKHAGGSRTACARRNGVESKMCPLRPERRDTATAASSKAKAGAVKIAATTATAG
jgi:inorganic pyrophosphatase